MILEDKLPRRDWVIFPLLSLFTLCMMTGITRSMARHLFPVTLNSTWRCLILDDRATGVRAIPNSVCSQKNTEDAQRIEYRFNNCGHRAGMECGPKSKGSYRIVMTGSSYAMGLQVEREDSFAALLPNELSRRTGQNIELYNESMEWGFPRSVEARFNEVLAANPDMILWVLTPWDIDQADVLLPGDQAMKDSTAKEEHLELSAHLDHLAGQLLPQPMHNKIYDWLERDSIEFMLRHFLYQSQTLYMNSYLMQADEAGFLKDASSIAWKNRLQEFNRSASILEARAKAAGVPLVVTLVPNRAQAAMISSGTWPASYNPYRLDNDLHTIISADGGSYLSILPQFSVLINSARYYYPVDDHLNARGHAVIAEILANDLIGSSFLATKVLEQQHNLSKGKR